MKDGINALFLVIFLAWTLSFIKSCKQSPQHVESTINQCVGCHTGKDPQDNK